MKKTHLIILAILIIGLVACNKNQINVKSREESSQINTESFDESSLSSQVIQYEQGSEQGFDYEVVNDQIKIIKCVDYNNSAIIIPEEIVGKPVKIIGVDAFHNHKAVSVKLPQGLTIIEDGAFYSCDLLKEITIPESVIQIGEGEFFRCPSLTKITVDKKNQKYSDVDGVLFNKDVTELISYPEGKKTQSYVMPNSVEKIAKDAFGYYCENLKKLTILSNVTEFPDYNIFNAYAINYFTMKVESDSAAEQYAKKYELKYEIIKK